MTALGIAALRAFAVKVGIKLAIKAHKGPLHDLAERFRAEIAESKKKAAKVIAVALVGLSLCGCMAFKRTFVFVHDVIDETLQEQKQMPDEQAGTSKGIEP